MPPIPIKRALEPSAIKLIIALGEWNEHRAAHETDGFARSQHNAFMSYFRISERRAPLEKTNLSIGIRYGVVDDFALPYVFSRHLIHAKGWMRIQYD